MTKILPLRPFPELCIPAGTGDALTPDGLDWAPDAQVLFSILPSLLGSFFEWTNDLESLYLTSREFFIT